MKPASAAGSAPVITVQPQNVSVPEGTPANFSVTATGATSYQWETADVLTPTNFSIISGATSSTYQLAFPTVAAHNGDKFRVKCTNTNGTTTSNTVTLTVTGV